MSCGWRCHSFLKKHSRFSTRMTSNGSLALRPHGMSSRTCFAATSANTSTYRRATAWPLPAERSSDGLAQSYILNTTRAQFEALLQEIAEPCEEWLTSAQTLGMAARARNGNGARPAALAIREAVSN